MDNKNKVIYRPHRGMLDQAMQEAKIFDSVEDVFRYICEIHNNLCNFFQITPEELCVCGISSDKRVGWRNMYRVCYEKPSKIKNIEGYKRYFGLSDDDVMIKKDYCAGGAGYFSTDFDIEKSLKWME